MMYETLAILAAFTFLYSITSGGLERTPINGALIFTAFGLALGPLGLGILKLDVDSEGLRTIAELTLALVLFTDASNANLGVLKKNIGIPRRLLQSPKFKNLSLQNQEFSHQETLKSDSREAAHAHCGRLDFCGGRQKPTLSRHWELKNQGQLKCGGEARVIPKAFAGAHGAGPCRYVGPLY